MSHPVPRREIGDRDLPVVALVCSAGGLPAIEQILSGLEPGFPAALIVLRHHDPHARDLLAG